MKKLSVFLSTLLFVGLAWFGVGCQGGAEAPRDGVFLHISHGADAPHRLLMALNMASIMADDKDVLVYFDIKGVEAVLQDAEEVTFSHFPSSKAALKALMDKNAVLMACPGCLKAAGKSKDDLIDGVRVADKQTFFTFTKGRIVTLDY